MLIQFARCFEADVISYLLTAHALHLGAHGCQVRFLDIAPAFRTCIVLESLPIVLPSYIGLLHAQSNGVRKDSATKRALAFKNNFISEISLSTSSMN